MIKIAKERLRMERDIVTAGELSHSSASPGKNL